MGQGVNQDWRTGSVRSGFSSDPKTGIEQSFAEWAMSFATENAVGIYYHLVDACAELAKMGRKFP